MCRHVSSPNSYSATGNLYRTTYALCVPVSVRSNSTTAAFFKPGYTVIAGP